MWKQNQQPKSRVSAYRYSKSEHQRYLSDLTRFESVLLEKHLSEWMNASKLSKSEIWRVLAYAGFDGVIILEKYATASITLYLDEINHEKDGFHYYHYKRCLGYVPLEVAQWLSESFQESDVARLLRHTFDYINWRESGR